MALEGLWSGGRCAEYHSGLGMSDSPRCVGCKEENAITRQMSTLGIWIGKEISKYKYANVFDEAGNKSPGILQIFFDGDMKYTAYLAASFINFCIPRQQLTRRMRRRCV